MFEENRSDFAAPVAGYLYMGLVATIACFFFFNAQVEITEFMGIGITSMLGMIGLVIAGFNLYKANLLEGFVFGVVSVYAFTLGSMHVPATFFALIVLLVVCGIVSFLSGYIDLPVLCGCFALAILFLMFDPEFRFAIIPAIFFLGAAVVSFYLAICNWLFYQELIDEYDEFCCDDDCCCGDDGCCCEDESAEAVAEPEKASE